jgi:hypothetical protein
MRRTFLYGVLLLATSSLAAQYQNPTPPPWFKGEKKDKGDGKVRTVEGAVRDANDNPVARAVVKLKNLKTLQIRSYYTKADGRYTFSGVAADNEYELRADFEGATSSPKILSVFDSREKAVINLKLEPKEQKEAKK